VIDDEDDGSTGTDCRERIFGSHMSGLTLFGERGRDEEMGLEEGSQEEGSLGSLEFSLISSAVVVEEEVEEEEEGRVEMPAGIKPEWFTSSS
jgi:hypothetical protein